MEAHPSYYNSKKQEISWGRFEVLIYQLNKKIDWTGIKDIFPIPRGGLAVGLRLSYINDKPFTQKPKEESTLVVDDLVDKGDTLEPYKDFTTAVLYYKPWSKIKPTYYVEETEDWIIFPYEVGVKE